MNKIKPDNPYYSDMKRAFSMLGFACIDSDISTFPTKKSVFEALRILERIMEAGGLATKDPSMHAMSASLEASAMFNQITQVIDNYWFNQRHQINEENKQKMLEVLKGEKSE